MQRLQEAEVVLRREQGVIAVELARRVSVDVHPPEALDVEHPADVEHVERVVVAECHGARQRAERDAVVEKLEVDALVGATAPR